MSAQLHSNLLQEMSRILIRARVLHEAVNVLAVAGHKEAAAMVEAMYQRELDEHDAKNEKRLALLVPSHMDLVK